MEVPMKALVALVTFLLVPAMAGAALKTKSVEYRSGDTVLEGYLAYDDSSKSPRPGILIVPDWMGISQETRRRCDMLAGLGYEAFAADVYGKGVRPATPDEAGKQAGRLKSDRPLLRGRLLAAFDILKKAPGVDTARLAAMGYCFGGMSALELARAGADLKGVVTFHGSLDTPHPEDGKNIKGRVLVLHGADDPFVPPEQVAAFQEEMRKAGADWQMVLYGGAVHAFTNPGAGSDNSKGAAYNARADERSWEAMRRFLAEIFR
jgi:dienelactone hydrolase